MTKRTSASEMLKQFAQQQQMQREARSLHRGAARRSQPTGLSLFVNPESEQLELKTQQQKQGSQSHDLKPDGDNLFNNIASNKKFELPTVESLPDSNSFSNFSNPAIQKARPTSAFRMESSSPKRVSSISRRARESS